MKKEPFIWRLIQLLSLCCVFLFFSIGLFAQHNQTIQGQILDAVTKDPLIGASILEKGTSNGTITDLDGNYSLKVASDAILICSYIGYVTQEIKVEDAGNILLKEDAETLDEVVVIGYGVQKKVNLSGAVTAIEGEKIAAKPASDVLSALQGEMPGVAVVRSGGQPGSETSGLLIRGISSVNSTKTLVLIDGIEGDLTLLNPNDIESISVLKDAASSAIYGARAAAGVVLVTTKNGKTGKTKVSYDGYFAFNVPGIMPERLPAWEEQKFIDESRINQSGNHEWTEEQGSWVANPNFNYRPNPNGRWDFFEATNWLEEGTKEYTTQQNHSVSVSGGTKELNYLVSAGYYTKNGILKYGPDSNDRYTIRMKFNSELNQYFSLAFNFNYQNSTKKQHPYSAVNLLERLYRVRGRQPIFNPEEDINKNPYNGDSQINAIDLMKNGGLNKSLYEVYTGKGTLTIQNVIKGLRINLSASRKAGYFSQERSRRHLVWYNRLGTQIRFQVNNPNDFLRKKSSDYQDLLEATAHYDIKSGEHSVVLLGGSSYENYRKEGMEVTVKDLNSNDFFSLNFYDKLIAGNTAVSDLVEPWSMMSYFGRVNYNYAERYLFEANVRYDGSSRLAPSHRWKAFPSFSFAWRSSEESWFNIDAISNLKARISWGQLGNGAVLGLYDYITLISSGTHLGGSYYFQNMLASKKRTWETIETTNIGVDMGLLDNRLSIIADYYWKYNKDMLSVVYLPSQVGIKTPSDNIGKLKTWGWEFEIGWKDKIKEVSYQVSFNLSDAQNKLLRYSGVNLIGEGNISLLEGYPINTIWGYQTDGYWSSRDEYLAYKKANPGYSSFQDGIVSGGDVKYVAQGNPDHKIGAGGATSDNPGDLVCLGDANGRYLYGLNLGIQWKGLDFSMMFQGVGKRTVLIDTRTIAPLAETSTMPWTIHRDYWTPDNPNARWPRLYNYNNGAEFFNYKPSDKWVQDGSYIRLKNITLGYTVPVKKNMAERVRIYLTGADVWEYTKMLSIFDPEVTNQAKATYYPFFRSWTVGLNVTF